MKENFNTYIDHIEPDFWRELCVKEGTLRHYKRGEEFAKVGHVARYVGYVKRGTMKYISFSAMALNMWWGWSLPANLFRISPSPCQAWRPGCP